MHSVAEPMSMSSLLLIRQQFQKSDERSIVKKEERTCSLAMTNPNAPLDHPNENSAFQSKHSEKSSKALA